MPEREKYFTRQIVRDLQWVIFSPPLITNIRDSEIRFVENLYSEDEKSFFEKLLTELEKNPSDLIDFVRSKNSHLLGKYFEALVEYSIVKSPLKKLLAANLQINSEGKTIGELDFIYRDLIEDKIIHLETAGKFFIAQLSKDNKVELLGPNPNDSFDKKIEKITTNQISLTATTEGKAKLRTIGIKDEVFPRALFKGYVFYEENTVAEPEFLNPLHMRGKVIRADNFSKLNTTSGKWKILERKEWVSPFVTKDEKLMCNWKALCRMVESYFKKDNYPLLISRLTNMDNLFIEKERYFVISKNWTQDFNSGRA